MPRAPLPLLVHLYVKRLLRCELQNMPLPTHTHGRDAYQKPPSEGAPNVSSDTVVAPPEELTQPWAWAMLGCSHRPGGACHVSSCVSGLPTGCACASWVRAVCTTAERRVCAEKEKADTKQEHNALSHMTSDPTFNVGTTCT